MSVIELPKCFGKLDKNLPECPEWNIYDKVVLHKPGCPLVVSCYKQVIEKIRREMRNYDP